ncbi:MAG: pyridoxamine 5'-phosphate oxidase family protein [Candidatus Nanopelagicales bacterium]|jgi:nitroimidazol reductase NimA-like FMN-containing flavoprotein (pyridoxamine 5'-phosphate oxidase superfamily)|nr:pyridoxamine 5'-phosphate oxidase family protein [Candidatus Nanopelagicales bacterium]MCU0296340.1 pyridoxamine 5'-phosphate oxidase family protein [Candidatus Nanopelagicales bacterium]
MDVLTEEQCWERLTSNQIGRLAVVVAGRPDIFPINYVIHEGEIYFKTAEGSKLAAVMTHHEVAFEIDGYDEDTNLAWSVVLGGMARALSHEAELDAAETLPLFPWNTDPKHRFVAIEVMEISGRQFLAEGRH